MSQPSWIGRSLSGRYQIEALLGQGGMSAVYKATDPNLKRVVAIKLIHSHLSSDAQFIQRFEEEAAAVASLRHPNIVQVFDFNSDQGVHYMVLEFVPGETLQERLLRLNGQQRKLPIEDALKITLNMCDALGYAHQRNIIHRDIKPANIMLDINGQAILMDFGIVKILGNNSHTATGAVLGTASYISPELIRSEQADPRSDIYSLGITLYEMLSGERPFKSDSAMTLMMMHLNDPVPDPRTLRADLPEALVNILLKSLEKDRARRYQNVAELAADLKRVLDEMQSGALPAVKSNPAPVTLIAAAAKAPAYAPAPPSNPNLRSSPDQQRQNYTPPPVSRTGSGVLQTTPPATGPVGAPVKKNNSLLMGLGLGCGLFVVIALLIGGSLYLRSRRAAALPGPKATASARAAIASTRTAIVDAQPSATLPAATATSVPTEAPTQAAIETPTVDPALAHPTFYAQINAITLSGNQYVVQYETMGFVEKMPWMHVHFFFNTVLPEQAGNPGIGPWMMYGGPRPFKGATLDKRPAGATQLCVLVANANHTVIPESGNCVDLPIP